MKRNPFLFILAVVLSVSMACSLKFDLPVDEITTGETVTEPIKVDLPAGTAEVEYHFWCRGIRNLSWFRPRIDRGNS